VDIHEAPAAGYHGRKMSLLSRVFILLAAFGALFVVPPASLAVCQPAVYKRLGTDRLDVSKWDRQARQGGQTDHRSGERLGPPGGEVLVAKAQTIKRKG